MSPMLMDGQADDCLIDEDGELVMLSDTSEEGDDEPPVFVVIVQGATIDTDTKELIAALHAMKGIRTVLKFQ